MLQYEVRVYVSSLAVFIYLFSAEACTRGRGYLTRCEIPPRERTRLGTLFCVHGRYSQKKKKEKENVSGVEKACKEEEQDLERTHRLRCPDSGPTGH